MKTKGIYFYERRISLVFLLYKVKIRMGSFIDFIKNSFTEFKERIEWPKWNELQSSILIVAVSALLLAVFTFSIDTLFSMSIKNLYSLFIGLFN